MNHTENFFHKSETEAKLFYTMTDVLNMKSDDRPLWKWVRKVGLHILFGEMDGGKSTLIRNLTERICLGVSDFLSWKINAENKRCLLISLEDSALDLKLKWERYKENPIDNLHILTSDLISNDEIIRRLEQILQTYSYDLIVLDPLRAIFKGQSNIDDSDVGRAMADLNRLTAKFQTAVVAISHPSKASSGTWAHSSLKGVNTSAANARCVMMLADGYLGCVKGNHLPKEEKEKAFKLHFNAELLCWERPTDQCEFQSELTRRNTENHDGADTTTRVEIEWSEVFDDNEEKLQNQELVRRCKNLYKCSKRTVERKIENDDLKTEKVGKIKMIYNPNYQKRNNIRQLTLDK